MKKIILVLLAGILSYSPAFSWGREAHETVARIAENNLHHSAKKKIENYLGDHSIVYYAKWMDEFRHTPEYSFTHKWHVVSVDENLKYLPSGAGGDAVYGIKQAIELLRQYKNLPDSTVAVNIKYLIHLVGDMHCPSHVKYLGRNQDYNVLFGGGYIKPVQELTIHRVWDEAAIQSSRIWSISEWANELDRKSAKEIKTIVAGSPEEWLADNASRCIIQFDMSAPGGNIAQDFVNEALPLIETQILYAGYRLAAVLNGIF